MNTENHIQIGTYAQIPMRDIWFETSRSSGPGGQHVNKVETRAVLCFDLSKTTALTPEQKALVETSLANRVNKQRVLRVASQSERTQTGNRRKAQERFETLLEKALTLKTPRTPTRPSVATKRRRLKSKRQRSDLKRSRAKRTDFD